MIQRGGVVCVSRDVVFQEDEFWLWKQQTDNEVVFSGFEHTTEELDDTENTEPGSEANDSSEPLTPVFSHRG